LELAFVSNIFDKRPLGKSVEEKRRSFEEMMENSRNSLKKAAN
jgi:hypothetical protein